MDSGVAALLGALVGGATSLIANYIQARAQRKQDLIKIATDLAKKEHDFDLLLHKEGKKLDSSLIAEYTAFYVAVLGDLDQGREVTPARTLELAKRYGVDVP